MKEQLRQELLKTSNQLGVNTQGLKFVKKQWKLQHASEFIDEEEQRQYEEKEQSRELILLYRGIEFIFYCKYTAY